MICIQGIRVLQQAQAQLQMQQAQAQIALVTTQAEQNRADATKKMVEAGQNRCIMYFDELDKTCNKNERNEITNILIHLTDPMTNSEFQDRFFQGINFPLNKVIFIFL